MKIKEVVAYKYPHSGPDGMATVEDLIDYLSQFPPDTPLIMEAEVDACSEKGYPFFYAHPTNYNPHTDGEPPIDENGDYLETDEDEVRAVVINVDH